MLSLPVVNTLIAWADQSLSAILPEVNELIAYAYQSLPAIVNALIVWAD
jgi:hypothetical protein